MPTELGSAYVQIIPSARGIKGMIGNELGAEMPSAGRRAGNMLVTGLKTAVIGGAVAIGAGLGKTISSSLSQGGALQQSLGGVETLFKKNADMVKNYAAQAYRTSGVSANQYMENVTSFSASLISSLGGDTKKAAQLANTAMIDMSDNANKMGTDMEYITQTYQSLARGNYAMLDNLKLGYGGTKGEMERLMADAEKITGEHYTVGDFADTVEAIHAVQKQMGITGTTAKEASTTLTGSMASMKASFKDVLGNLALGKDLGPSLNALATTTSTFLFNNFLPMVGNVLKGLPTAIGGFLQQAGPLFLKEGKGMIQSLGQGMTGGVGAIVGNIVKAFSPLGQALQTVFGQIPQLLKTVISQISPIIATIGTTLGQLKFDGIKNFIEAIIPALNAGFQSFMNVAGPAITPVVEAFKGMWNAAQPLITILGQALMPVLQIVGSFLGGIFKGALIAVKGAFDLIKIAIEILTPVFNVLLQGLTFLQPAFSWIAEKVGTIIGLFGGLGGITNGLKGIMTTAWTNIETVITVSKNVISAAINIIKSVFSGAGSSVQVLKNVFSLAWRGIQTAVNVAKSIISGAINAIKGAFNAFGSTVSSVGGTVKNVINSIKNIFNSLRNINLAGAGQAIMNSFLGGLKSAWGGVTNFVGGIAGWIKEHKGPIEYDRKLLIPAGKAIMFSLNEGLVNHFANVKKTVIGIAGEIASLMDSMMLDTFASDVDKQLEVGLSSTKLQMQVEKNISDEYDTKQILKKLSERPIVVSNQINGTEFARMVAKPINDVQKNNEATLIRLGGGLP